MQKKKKQMAILSNTSSPSHIAKRRLNKYGLHEAMFAGGLVSSGEECARYIRENFVGKKKKALWFTWKESEKQNPMEYLLHCENNNDGQSSDNDVDSSSTTVIDVATTVDEADFILLHGSEVWRRTREVAVNDDDIIDLNFLYNEDYTIIDDLLQQAARRELPLVCANPDLIVGLPGGVVGNMPGKIANRYEHYLKEGEGEGRGLVNHFGEPNPRHFHSCLENLGMKLLDGGGALNTKIDGVTHVGDSLHHDVAGATSAGIDSIFVLGGIHAKELGLTPTSSDGRGGIVIVDDNDNIDPEREEKGKSYVTKAELTIKLNAMFEDAGIWPTHVVPSLSLGTEEY